MTEIKLRQNDKGVDLYFRIKDSNDAAVNVSGATVTFMVGHGSTGNMIISGACTSPSGGETDLVKYTVTGGSLSTVGTYDAELQCDFDSNTRITVGGITVRVEGDL